MAEQPKLRLTGPRELPRTLREYADVENPFQLAASLEQKLGGAGFWLQTHGPMYGIVVPGSKEASLISGGSFYAPVCFAGMRRLRQVEDLRHTMDHVFVVAPPPHPVAVFDIRATEDIDSPFLDTDAADYLELGVLPGQAITLLEDKEYQEMLADPDPMMGHLRLVVDNTHRHDWRV